MLHKSFIKNIDDYLCPPDISIRDAMVRITGKFSLFQVVVDVNRKVLGTLTDGDIRRSILRGVTPDDHVHACMNTTPITGRVGEDAENSFKLEQIHAVGGEHANFLPIVGPDDVLSSILVYDSTPTQSPNALIMAGGLGARLGERTKNTPKPLLHIGDKPILEHIVNRLEKAGVEEVFISVCYLAEQIEAYVEARNSQAEINIIHETEPLGTAGSIGLLPNTVIKPFLILNGDVLTSVDYGALFEFHARHEYDATIAVAQYRTQIPFGVVRHGEDGLFTGIDEKPNQEHFVAAGIYLLSPEFRTLISPKEYIDMPALLNKGRKLGLKIGLFPIHEYWADIGRPDDFDEANGKYDKG